MKESELQKSILDYLGWKHIFHYRNNSGAMVATYKGKDRFFRFGAAGSPDIVCVINGRYVGIEVKAPRGKQSEHQKEFQNGLEKAGGAYFVIRSLEEAEAALQRLSEPW